MTTIEIMNYEGKKKSIEVEKLVFPFIVTVITGDEVITMGGKEYDASYIFDNPRIKDYYYGEYIVTEDKYEDWCNRTQTFDNGFIVLDVEYVKNTFFDAFKN